MGLLDDQLELSAAIKFFGQVAASVILFYFDDGFHSVLGYTLPTWAGLTLTVVWCVGIINAFNLIDGLDGLAAGLPAVSSFCIGVWILLSGQAATLAVIVFIFCFSCLGFLRYNFHPARIFMGDTGSMFIGFFFAYISTSQVSKAVTFMSLLLPILAIGIPIFDVFLAIWRRLVRKLNNPENPNIGIMTGDHDHLHHRILSREHSQSKTALILYLFAALTSIGAMALVFLSGVLPALAYMLLFLGVISAIRMADVELLDSATYILKGLKIPRRNLFLTMIHPLLDIVLILAAYCIMLLLCFFRNTSDAFALILLLTYIAPYIIVLSLSNVYKTYWLRAGINRYFLLIKCLMLAFFIMVFLSYTLYMNHLILIELSIREYFSATLLYGLLVFAFIALERFSIRDLESFGLRLLSVKKHKHEDQKLDKILIVGGGLSCRLYLSGLFCQDQLANPFDIVGIIDDCKDLSRLNIYGFDVLGSSQDLEQLHTKYAFDKMIVTPGRLQPSTLDNLNRFQKNHPETVILYFHLHLSPVNAVVQHEEKDLLNLNTQKISLFNEEIDNMKKA